MQWPKAAARNPRSARGVVPAMTTTRPLRTHQGLLVAGLLISLSTVACSGGAAATPAASPTGVPPASSPAEPSMEVPTVQPTTIPGGKGVPPAIIAGAVGDAAARAGVDPAAVTVVSAAAVTWPNGAAGCPKPDFMYTDALVPGYRVVVEAGGRTYDYRGSVRGGSVSWCEDAAPFEPGAAG
jgi:hypothetical protein